MADAYIPLQVRTPNLDAPSPLDIQKNSLTLRDMAQRSNLNQQASQINDLRIQQEQDAAQQRAQAMQAQQTISDSLLKNGGDYEKVQKDIAGKLPWPYQKQFDEDVQNHQRAALQLPSDQLKLYGDSMDMIGREAAALLQLPPSQRGPEAQQAIQRAKAAGMNTDSFQFDPVTGPTDDQLNALLVLSKYNGNIVSYAQKQDKLKRDRMTQEMEDAARTHLGVQNQQQHDQWLQSLPPEIQPYYKNLSQLDDVSKDAIQNMPLTSMQRQTQATKAQQASDLADYRQRLADINDSRTQAYRMMAEAAKMRADAMEARAQSGGGSSQTANSQAVDQRQARSQYAKLADAESQLNKLRYQLGKAISTPASQRSTDDLIDKKTGLARNLDTEYEQATQDLIRVMGDKYDAAARAGMGTPQVPLEDAIAAIRRGDQKKGASAQTAIPGVGTPAPAATAPSAAPAAPAPAPAPASPVAAPPAASAKGKISVGQTVYGPKGEPVVWDGRNYVNPKTKKPLYDRSGKPL